MTVWNTVYLVIGIIAGIVGIWNLARQRNIFLALTGILWFLVTLFSLPNLRNIYDYRIAEGVPGIGTLVLFILIPVFFILAFFSSNRRS
jgi:tetrahydromethanopterin S-methyltransferase subunit C